MKACIVVPLFDQPHALAALFDALAKLSLPCLVVDDGSGAETKRALDVARSAHAFVTVRRHERNRGKGAALRTGLFAAREAGFSHALLVDADGQHDPEAWPALLAVARARPEALVLAAPIFGPDAPASRLRGRKLSLWCARLETLSRAIGDPLCGLRCVPIAPATALLARHPCGDRMEFDPELAVRMAWAGNEIVNVPARVHYPAGGVSHFRMLRDNARISWMHARLIAGMLLRIPRSLGARASRAWWRKPERGARLGIRFVVFAYRSVGRWLASALVWPIVAYFFATDRSARRASREYLARVRGVEPSSREVFQHFLEFGRATLDRLGFYLGSEEDFALELDGMENLWRFTRNGRGVLLLGAHVGSFEAMRLLAGTSPVGVTVLMHEANAARIASVVDQLEELRPRNGRVRIVEVVPGAFTHLIAARQQIAAGGVVAVLADRLAPGAASGSVRARFLGDDARFPDGPLRLAAALRCPVVTMSALRAGERRYRVEVRPFAERVELPRGARATALAPLVQAYASWLEALCRRAPLQWFNFFDYWGTGRDGR
ncbi:MAG TPA: glycosyltransferase [Myxococcota bacterium]|nr:glycosyltransferase [Myxococcota bacterium]